MTTHIAVVLCSTLLGFCLSLIVMILLGKARPHSRQGEDERIKQLQAKLDRALGGQPAAPEHHSFAKSLAQASLTTELQFPRLQRQTRAHQPPPEKYTILNKLISRGLDKEEIASILGISRIEASQLMTLRSMAEAERSGN
ncbi:hypothetical protein [Desulfogranum mediterraneum]|uniref:hypothetical protein n=1 Tax=Desulfogranum mediterraneum TaxID=160661 RepID=UPI0004205C80|nr:hypothetical protein [Desulfogranum mediterraneum]